MKAKKCWRRRPTRQSQFIHVPTYHTYSNPTHIFTSIENMKIECIFYRWARHGVDPGHYSRLLTKTVVKMATDSPTRPLVDIVHDSNIQAASQHLGTATCTTLRIADESTVSTLNIGDSGYSIHRISPPTSDNNSDGGKPKIDLLFASEPGQKRFNFPDQIGGQHGDVVAKVAVPNSHTFQDGDIFIVYSDGVSDNLWPEDFHTCISTFIDEENIGSEEVFNSYSSVADCIARTAYELGKDQTFDSPFSRGAREAGWSRAYALGGKVRIHTRRYI